MRSRKTLELILIGHEADFAGKSIVCFHPSDSERWEKHNCISSRIGYTAGTSDADTKKLSYPSIPIPRDLSCAKAHIPDGVDIVMFDDAHFFSNHLITLVDDLRNDGTSVYISGLDMDCFQQPFGPMPFLMAKADFVEKRTAICKECGEPAQLSIRLTDHQEISRVGDDEYIVLCHDCAQQRESSLKKLYDITEDLVPPLEEVTV